MRIEFDLEPAEVGILLDAVTDYRDRTQLEADAERYLATVPSPVIELLARQVQGTTVKIIDQLAPYADAVPAVARTYDEPVPVVLPGRHL